MWDVLTGRRDGTVSLASDVTGNLPSPFSDFATLQQLFAKKSLNINDLVALSGGIVIQHRLLLTNRPMSCLSLTLSHTTIPSTKSGSSKEYAFSKQEFISSLLISIEL